MLFGKITLVGVGLLGGSLALAIRARNTAQFVRGYVRRGAAVTDCESAGLRGFATCDLLEAVHDADLVILCTPLAQMHELTERFIPALKAGAIVTDVGSVKASVVAELESIVASAGAQFIGAHPMAGAERTGVSAARADLFRDAVCVLTPTSKSSPTAVEQLQAFWTAIGSRVITTTPELHDELVARSSHLPHVLAAQLTTFVLDPVLPKHQLALCANGFRDTTRIASGSPEMWRDIALANRENLSQALDVFIRELEQTRDAIQRGDAKLIEAFFHAAKHRRDAWCAQTASPSPE
ncbi:MAG TPA: prephenate dehydrogenase/arogenate dehydrogenase family protein [Candidatus Acidoferrum sp.]|nr:prephenate dehydrogenase/arogenate dehydrogenase family protein [Candidatus Acidoferrum sp.]